MRKLLNALICACVTISASAQLKVTSNGNVQVGTVRQTIGTSGGYIKPGVVVANPDTAATLLLGNENSRIALGTNGHAHIAVHSNTATIIKNCGDALELYGAGGVMMKTQDKTIFSYDASMYNLEVGGSATVQFGVPVSAPQYLTSSDVRCKTDIEPLENMGSLLKEIVPVSYVLISDESGENGGEATNAPSKINAQDTSNANHQYGFLAQDVREVYPELVYEDSEGMLSIDYTGFIPLLVDAIQSLQATVDAQAAEIESLKGSNPQVQQTENTVVASLSQNRPNPFRTTTTINCVLPDNVSSAFLCVYDLNGNQKIRRDISERGSVDISIEGNILNAGMYIYALVADGIEIDSKRMILTD